MPALLFDLDGTLANTNADLHAAMNHVLVKYGYNEVPSDAVHHMIGGGARMILQRGLAENGVTFDDDKLDIATEELVLWYDQNIDTYTHVYDNLMPILDNARAANYKMAVVTNKRESLSSKLLFRLNIHAYFDVLIGGDTLPTRKPNAAPITEALKRLGTPADEALMVGDSEADTGSARAANVACLCVSFGYRRVSLDGLGADAIIDDYSEFAAAAKALKPGLFDAL